jgi:hypothetical protein
MIKFLEKNKDYEYSFPYGHYAQPQIKILSGEYKGLVFDIESSAIVTLQANSTLNVEYNIIKYWESNTNKVIMREKDKEFICHAAYSFIRDYNFELKGKLNGSTSIP